MEVPEAEPRAIGITMGTYQVAGCLMEHSSANLYFDKGHVELPCYVAFTDTECLLGRRAMDQMVDNPENTIYDIKRLLGRFYDDPEIQDYLKEWPFTVIDDHNRPKYQVMYKGQVTTFYPEEIIALFFKAIKEHAEHHLYMPVTEAVITVPAQFNILQRQSTVDASLMAGLTVLQIINETTAAAIVYGFLRPHIENEGDKNIAMISVGCGFLDVSLITYDDRVFECKSTRGTCRLDINRSMIHYFAGKILDKHGVDVFKDKAAYLRLWKACELAKCKLKLERECTIVVPWINPVSDFEDKFTRDQFNEILGELKETLRTLLYKCLSDAGWSADSLHECLMVGGSSEIHCLENAFRDLGTLTRSCQVLDYPHLHAVVGAAMRATSLKGGHQMGLADLITLEIAPRTFGVMTREGKCRSLVKHNESIPQWSSEDYTTYADNQAFIHIEVYDGESRIASENKLMGRYCVTDFPLRKRGKTHIRVTFHVDLCGLLVIWAEDKSPDALETPITVRNETGLILREELQAVTQLFHNTFPPEPVPRWTVAEQEQLAVANQQNPVDADVQPGNVQQAEADNAQPQNGAPVLNGHPEGDGNPGQAGNGEAGDGGGCVPIVMNSNL